MQDKKPINKKIIEILLNKMFVLDNQETNEEIIKQNANRHVIKQQEYLLTISS